MALLDEAKALADKYAADVEALIKEYEPEAEKVVHDLAPVADAALAGLEAIDPAAAPIVAEGEKIAGIVPDAATAVEVIDSDVKADVAQVATAAAPVVADVTEAVDGNAPVTQDSPGAPQPDGATATTTTATRTPEDLRSEAADLMDRASALIAEAEKL